jgi:hypothetical protein
MFIGKNPVKITTPQLFLVILIMSNKVKYVAKILLNVLFWIKKLTACLFCMKVEGKIEEGWKVAGLIILPSFGTTLKREERYKMLGPT